MIILCCSICHHRSKYGW